MWDVRWEMSDVPEWKRVPRGRSVQPKEQRARPAGPAIRHPTFQIPHPTSEIPLALAVFHGGVGVGVVDAPAALAGGGGGDLGDDVVDGAGFGFDSGGAGHVADGAEADAPAL